MQTNANHLQGRFCAWAVCPAVSPAECRVLVLTEKVCTKDLILHFIKKDKYPAQHQEPFQKAAGIPGYCRWRECIFVTQRPTKNGVAPDGNTATFRIIYNKFNISLVPGQKIKYVYIGLYFEQP